jgi:hypothetical protein
MGDDEFLRVNRELAQLRSEGQRRVILHLALLSSATRMSLARLLVCAREFQRDGGELKLAGLSPSLRYLAELEGFDKRADFQPDLATALKSFSPSPPTRTRSQRKRK